MHTDPFLTLCVTGSLVLPPGATQCQGRHSADEPAPTTASIPVQSVAADSGRAGPDPVVRDGWVATGERRARLNRERAAEAARKAEAAKAAEIAAARESGVLLTSPAPVASYSGEAVYQEALRYLGVPYVFGGSSWDGMDCSGLVLRAFSAFGIDMPHSAMGQAAMGVIITRAQARHGDLVVIPGQHIGFWSSPGMFLEAPHPGANVRIHSIWADYYIVRIMR